MQKLYFFFCINVSECIVYVVFSYNCHKTHAKISVLLYLTWQFTLMVAPTTDKDHLVMNGS